MPVVTLAAPSHPAIGGLLAVVADAVAGALALGAGDVVVTHIPTGASALSGTTDAPTWAIVTVHGSDRGRERMASALAAVETTVQRWSADHTAGYEGVWTEWLLPAP